MSYYLMHRGWMENDLFRGEPYSMRSAWVWLIENAAWEPTTVRIERTPVHLEKGELSFSEPFLATKWKWSRSRVHRFLGDLTTWGMISRRNSPTRKSDRVANRGQSIITLCNYDKYQDVSLILEQRRGQTLNRVRTDSEQKNNTGNTGKQEKTLGAFEEFWQAYPSRGGHPNPKKPARLKFELACKHGTDPATIIAGAAGYAEQVSALGTQSQYVKQAVTWINQEGWNDVANGHDPLADAGLYDGPTEPAPEIEGWEIPMDRAHH